MTGLTVALAQWRIGTSLHFDDFALRVEAEVQAAVARQAQLIVLPEYLALELARGFSADVYSDVSASLAAVDGLYPAWQALFAGLARRHGIYLQAGTFLKRQPDGRYRNRALLFSPQGTVGYQDKLCLTGYEKQTAVISPGDALRVFNTEFGRLGIAICYDSEFPLYARAQAMAGAGLLLVPSCTDTQAGASRVRIGCQARALENQFPVLCAVTAGISQWSPVLDINSGRAAIYVQPDRGLPDDGVLAQQHHDATWLVARLDLDGMRDARGQAQVGVAADWNGQLRPVLQHVQLGTFATP